MTNPFYLRAALLVVTVLCLGSARLTAGSYVATDEATLRAAIIAANADPGSTITVNAASITLTSALPIITSAVSISGNGSGVGGTTISGNNLHRIFFVDTSSSSAAVSIAGFNLINGRAKGGDGGAGGGGGGLGAGGAIFVNSGAVTVQSIGFTGNAAIGGNGGSGGSGDFQSGGGGGLGGNGGTGLVGTAAGGGGYMGNGGSATSYYGGAAGGGGLIGNGGNGGVSSSQGAGGGGLTAGSTSGAGGTGGGNGGTTSSNNDGANGSLYGGGGGGGSGSEALGGNGGKYGGGGGAGYGDQTHGGNGGDFGGGGGADGAAGVTYAGNGGWGGGGGGSGLGQSFAGTGGFGGGGGGSENGQSGGYLGGRSADPSNGFISGGGGGGAAGGAIFVRSETGGSLTIVGSDFDTGTVTGGTGASIATFISQNGSAAGSALFLSGTTNVSVPSGSRSIAGSISDAASGGYTAASLVKTGSGTLVLGGTNSYNGTTTVSAGTLSITNAAGLGTTLNGTTVASGATLSLDGLAVGAEAIGLDGSGVSGNGALNTAGTASLAGTIALAGNASAGGASIGGTGTLTLSNIISGGALTKVGSSTLILTAANTYAGGTTVSAGTLQIGTGGTLGSINGNLVNNAAVIFNRSNDLAFDGNISGSGTLNKSGGGTLTLGGANTYSGATTIDGGTLKISSAASTQLPATTTVLIHNNAVLDLGGGSRSIAGLGTASDGVVGNITNGTLSAGAGGIFLRSGTTSATFTGSSPTGRLWIGGDSSATVNLNGTNNMIFTTDNHSVIIGHPTTGAAGTVKVGNANALAEGTQEVQVFTGTLDFNGQSNVRAGNLMLLGNGNSYLINSSTTSAASTTSTIGLSAGSNVGGAGDLTLSGVIQGGGLIKIGAGKLTLTGANTYSGTSALNSGTVNFSSSSSFGTSSVALNGGVLQWATGNTADISSKLSLSGGVLDTNGNAVTFASSVSGAGGLTKTGAGKLTLTAANTYSGSTIINAGTLALSGGNERINPASNLFINNGSTLDLGGTTQSFAAVSSNSQHIVGNITAGTLSTNGDIYLQSGTFANTFTSSVSSRLFLGGDASATVTLNGTNDGVSHYNSHAGFDTGIHNQVFIGVLGITGVGGTVKLGSSTALAAATESVILSTGTLDLNGQSNVRGKSIIIWDENQGNALVNNNTTQGASFAGNVRAGAGWIENGVPEGGTNFGGAGNLTLSGQFDGYLINKIGGGSLTINESFFTNTVYSMSGFGRYLKITGGRVAIDTALSQVNLGSNSTIAFENASILQFVSPGNLEVQGGRYLGSSSSSVQIETTGQTVTLLNADLGNSGLHKSGAGTLILADTGSGNYSSQIYTHVGEGTLVFTAAGQLSQTNLQIDYGAHLDLGGTTQTMNSEASVSIIGGSLTNGTIDFDGELFVDSSGTIDATLNGTNNGGNQDFYYATGLITLGGVNNRVRTLDNRLLSISGGGTVRLLTPTALAAATENPTISNTTLDLNGQLNVRANSLNLGHSAKVINNSTTSAASFAGGVQLLTSFTQLGGIGTLNLSGVLNGTGGFTKIGAGKLTLSGASTYTGTTSINDGILSVDRAEGSGSGALGNGGNITFGGGTLQYTSAAAGADFSGRIKNSASSISVDTNGQNVTWTGVINASNTGGLTKNGTGTLNLGASNTYTGGTILNSGTLEIGNATALSSGKITINGGIIRAAGQLRTLHNAVQLNGNFGLGRSTNFTGDITLGNNITIHSTNPDNSPATSSIISGVIHDDSVGNHRSLTFDEGVNPIGRIVLSGANTYSGGTTLAAGTLAAGHNQALGSGQVTVNGGTLLIQRGISVSNQIQLSGGTLARVLAGNADLTHAVDADSGSGTKAELLAGKLSGSNASDVTLQTSFSLTSSAFNDSARIGAVYHLSGMPDLTVSEVKDTFVLQLTVPGVGTDSYLGWLSGGIWVNAVDGNFGNVATGSMLGFDGSYADFLALNSGLTLDETLGAYGSDDNGNTVWAVVNHNSDFSVIAVPEPAPAVLLAVGLMVLGLSARRRGRGVLGAGSIS